jgi:hypothetical protein
LEVVVQPRSAAGPHGRHRIDLPAPNQVIEAALARTEQARGLASGIGPHRVRLLPTIVDFERYEKPSVMRVHRTAYHIIRGKECGNSAA